MPLKKSRKKTKNKIKKNKTSKKKNDEMKERIKEKMRSDEMQLHGQAHALTDGEGGIEFNQETEKWENMENYKSISRTGKIPKFISFRR